jgi:hypothetical protein
MTAKKTPIPPDPEPGDREELIGLLWTAARRGNVPAMRILLDEMKGEREPKHETSTIDELARRRQAR